MGSDIVPAQVPLAGNVVSTILSMVTFGVLGICLTRRLQIIRSLRCLPLAGWLILIIYIDSTLFVFVTAIISRGFGINESTGICEGAILLCLVCYMSTKVLIYFFLVEKAHIIRGSRLPRMKTKLFLFNFFCMLVPYVGVVVLNFAFRIAYINGQGVCIIGMRKISMMPLIASDVVINIYLTILFIIPLRRLYSYKHSKNTPLHKMAFRTFIGSCATLTSSVVNLTVLMALKGEPAWICLMCCNADILFSVLVLHWVTAIDSNKHALYGNGSRNQEPPQHLDHITMGDNATKSQRASVQAAWNRSSVVAEPKKIYSGTITTEIGRGKMLARGRGDDDDGENVEMDRIRVQTEHLREIEIDAGSREESSDGYHGFSTRSTASTEKMV